MFNLLLSKFYQGVFNDDMWKYTSWMDFLKLKSIKVCLIEGGRYTLLIGTIQVFFKRVHDQKNTPCLDLRFIKVCLDAASESWDIDSL